jgi:hypothetical protein
VVAQAPAPSKAVPNALTATGAVVLGAGVAGLAYSFIRYDAFQKQQVPGTAEWSNPSVGKSELRTLSVVYPASWVATAVGAAVLSFGLFSRFHATDHVAVAPAPGGGAVVMSGRF